MEPEDWRRTEECFLAAIELPRDERADYLDRACGERADLRAVVESMLAAHDEPVPALEKPLFGAGTPGIETLAGLAEGPADDRELGPDRAIGTRFGAYELTQRIDAGGMGAVYLARRADDAFEQRVAVKVMHAADFLGGAGDLVRRFEQERQTLANLEHPYIARLVDGGAAGGVPFLVMEYIEGRPIDDWCREEGLTVLERLALFCRVCEAVQYAHQKLVVHRDIKPANVLVASDGTPKLLDFGIAKILDPADPLDKTQPLMTPEYASPEQIRGDPVTVASDVHGLGLLLFELLTGEKAFGGETRPSHAVLLQIAEEDAPAPSQVARDDRLRRQLRGDLDAIVAVSLRKEPERRYASVEQLAADVRRHLEGLPVRAHRDSLRYRAGKFLRRHALAVLALSAIVLGAVFSVFFAVESRRSEAAVRRLSDQKALDDLKTEAEGLWPAHPENVGRYRSWCERAETLYGRLPLHRAALRSGPQATERPGIEEWSFEIIEGEWLAEKLSELVRDLEDFGDPGGGLLGDVRRRLSFAQGVEGESIAGPRAAPLWDEAARAIAGEGARHVYGGLEIEPQLGLLPLGPDPRSGLWEFAHLQTGDVPRRSPTTGELEITEDTGLVFVLLPGGRFWMGAQKQDANAPNHGSVAYEDEAPVHEVELDPLFLSKYEMTQAQWLRFTGENPSQYTGGEHFLSAPVELVTWLDCQRVLTRMELALPTEAQWEYAARAGSEADWWTGADPAALAAAANVACVSYARCTAAQGYDVDHEPWDDGFCDPAPVGSLAPNAFGLHDVAGNVNEWCRDGYDRTSYARGARPGDGLHAIPGGATPNARVFRGGSFSKLASEARSAYRGAARPTDRAVHLGLRPARVLQSP